MPDNYVVAKEKTLLDRSNVIIIEGPDGCGKTQICRKLSEVTGFPTFKRKLDIFNEAEFFESEQFNFKDATIYDQTYIVDFLSQTDHKVIFDRAYPSEFVYSRVLERPTDIDMLGVIDKQFAKLNTLIVICLRKEYKYDDELIDRSYFDDIHFGYEYFSTWTSCRNLTMYVDNEDLDEEIEKIMGVL